MQRKKPAGGGLNRGEVAAIQAVKRAAKEHGEGDPLVEFCLEQLVDIASGKRRGRYLGDSYRALVQLCDRAQGKPGPRAKRPTNTRMVVDTGIPRAPGDAGATDDDGDLDGDE